MSIRYRNQLLQKFLEWASLQADIRAVALVGSAARVDHPADDWSDYDLIVTVSDPQVYFFSTDWLAAVGNPWVSILERPCKDEVFEVRVLFEGGFDIDLILVSIENTRLGFRNIPMLLEIMQRGTQVLLDKDNLLSTLPALPNPEQTSLPPSRETFLGVVNDFWFHVAWTAKKLRRGEIWIAKSCCDNYLKGLLLHVVEWEAQSIHGWELNTWFRGRFIEEWALPETVEELRQIFAYYDTEDIWRALFATMKMFRRIARELAKQLAYPYPVDGDEQVSEWVSLIRSNV